MLSIFSIEKSYLEFNFSGKGKDNYIEKVSDSYKNQYGLDLAEKLMDEKRVELKPIKGLKKMVILNYDIGENDTLEVINYLNEGFAIFKNQSSLFKTSVAEAATNRHLQASKRFCP